MRDYSWLDGPLLTLITEALYADKTGKSSEPAFEDAKQAIIAHLEAAKPEEIPHSFLDNSAIRAMVEGYEKAVSEYDENIRRGGKIV